MIDTDAMMIIDTIKAARRVITTRGRACMGKHDNQDKGNGNGKLDDQYDTGKGNGKDDPSYHYNQDEFMGQ